MRSIFSSLLISLTLCACATTPTTSRDWENTVSLVSSGVVTIQVDSPIAFDGLWNSTTAATGFIVDAKQGIVLTNRHVVTPGPVTARAIFQNNEEVQLTALYRDPVHDFGFYKYNPKHLRHTQPHEFKLNPEAVQVGLEIRVIGNDDGQKLSIHGGTISRIDRAAPVYKTWHYTDFNTYYIQAASGTTSGASGSPVINVKGEVVALNAGARTKSANAFYLPLQQVYKTFKALQAGKAFSRGTLQATYNVKPYAELKRLGLTNAQENKLRKEHPNLKGKLVIDSIIPESPAAQHLKVGDILLNIDDDPIKNFIDIESKLNAAVDKRINIEVIRHGEKQQFQVEVSDLHKFTPNNYVSFDNGIFHDLSYQQARYFNKPIEGVYIANLSHGFREAKIPRHAVITQINDQEIRTTSDFLNAIQTLADHEKAHVRFFNKSSPHILRYALASFNQQWFSSQHCIRDDNLGYWPCTPLNNQSLDKKKRSIDAQVKEHAIKQRELHLKHPEKLAANISPALTLIKHTMPYPMHGISNWKNQAIGTGLIVDTQRGRIITDRATVPSSLGNLKITFFSAIEVEGNVEYIHPYHNLVVLSYDPSELDGIGLQAAKLSDKKIVRGENVMQVGFDSQGQLEFRKTTIETIDALRLGYSNVPRFRDQNIDVIELANPRYDIDGPILNEKGEVLAFWGSFQGHKDWIMRGIQADLISELLNLEANDESIRSLEIELSKVSTVEVLDRGLPSEWLKRFREKSDDRGRFLSVVKVAADTPSASVFESGDLLLAIDDTMVTNFRDVEKLSQSSELQVTLFREGKILETRVKPAILNGYDIDHIVKWAGASLHMPHRAVAMQRGLSTKGVWITQYWYGSPASRYKLHATNRIVEIDGEAVETLEDFIKLVKNKAHQESVKIKLLKLDNKEKVITLNTDSYYWPLFEVKRNGKGWKKILHAPKSNEFTAHLKH